MEGEARGTPETRRSALWLRRAGWLVALWLASVLALGAVAYALRFVLGWAGLRL